MMVLSIVENAEKLWDAWNIRGFIILSLLVQVILILFAPLRKRRCEKRGKSVDLLIWLTYLLADWIAGATIGFILRNQINKGPTNSGQIQALWAPFLLLHLGGPDTITSFSLEDNEFWRRHLLGLALQVGYTIYIFYMSLPNNKLWLPTLLVFIAGIIKYAERNRAFYVASFDHLGEDWVSSEHIDGLPIPVEFQKLDKQSLLGPPAQASSDQVQASSASSDPAQASSSSSDQVQASSSQSVLGTAAHHFGTIKMMLVGPLLTPNQCFEIRETFRHKKSSDVLQIIEIELSLLYEVLHTKLPVVACRTGYILRVVNLSCILGALLSFSLFKNNYNLWLFDICLTYGLLIGAIALDFISIRLLIFSDWISVAHCWSKKPNCMNKLRWSTSVSQLNFITYYVKDDPVFLKELADRLHIRSFLDAIKGYGCLSSHNFRADKEWSFIFDEVIALNEIVSEKMKESSQTALEAKQVWLYSRERILENFSNREQFIRIIEELDYTKSVITWHIATELCFQEDQMPPTSETGSGSRDYKALCKLFSGYMFYLVVMQPAMMSAVSVSWKTVLENTLAETRLLVRRSSISNEKDAIQKILRLVPNVRNPERDINRSTLFAASELAKRLKQSDSSYPWQSMSKIWVQLMCFAAINCRPYVHAQQPSKGGELLTLVWLLMNHLGLGTHFSSHL
ncbi:hypothetical protein SLA2020_106940 [Shorea laevis]